MWVRSYETDTDVPTVDLWRRLVDVGSWGEWNPGIERIEVDGPVQVGTTFRMTPPGEDTLHSTVVALQPGRLITDRTEVNGIVVDVEHRLDPTPEGSTIVYRIEVRGPIPDQVAAEIGTGIAADFPEVMRGLVAAAGTA